MKNPEFVTVQDLYIYAMQHNLLDARIRICDGMAVSYYPDPIRALPVRRAAEESEAVCGRQP